MVVRGHGQRTPKARRRVAVVLTRQYARLEEEKVSLLRCYMSHLLTPMDHVHFVTVRGAKYRREKPDGR
jgi:hypothetical protein